MSTSPNKILRKFGRYLLLDRLAQGGMAEIYRAWSPSLDGGGRLIVLKCVGRDYGDNPDFLGMFRSEIKLTMALTHPNIVQVYDFGEEQGQPYIAMEYVEGKSLKQFLDRLLEKKGSFPIEFAAYITEQIATALHYAHSFKDRTTGQSLNLVHRDISPQNILISYDGNVKVIDFGIAKAATNSNSTRPGIIKGKPSYLSPEQLAGEQLDGRSDVFSLGVVLWELLTGRKLFAGENDTAILNQIENAKNFIKAPSQLNNQVPRDLDSVVLRALQVDRNNRFQNAEDFQRILHRFLYMYDPEFNPADFSVYIQHLFRNDIDRGRAELQALNAEARKILSVEAESADTELKQKRRGGLLTTVRENTTRLLRGLGGGGRGAAFGKGNTIELRSEDQVKVELEGGPVVMGRSSGGASRRRGGFQRHTVTDLGERATGASNPGASNPDVAIELATRSRTKTPAPIDPEAVAPRAKRRKKKKGGPSLLFVALILTGIAVTLWPEPKKSVPTSRKSGNVNPVPTRKSGPTAPAPTADSNDVPLRIRVIPSGLVSSISVNEARVDPANPIAQIPKDTAVQISVDSDGFVPIRQSLLFSQLVPNSADGVLEATFQLEPEHPGYLTIRATPSAEVEISNGRYRWHRSTPIEREKFPAGDYQVTLVNRPLDARQELHISLQEGKVVFKDVNLLK